MLPWSVIATAGMPSAATRGSSSSILFAPSSSEYCVCRCRWTKLISPRGRRPLAPRGKAARSLTPPLATLGRARARGFRADFGHSHSIVAGGFDEMSYTTRLTPRTSLVMRRAIVSSVSWREARPVRGHAVRGSRPRARRSPRRRCARRPARRPSAPAAGPRSPARGARASGARASSSRTIASAARSSRDARAVDRAEDAHREPRSRERLARDQLLGEAPSWRPTARTSSLNSSRSGSISSSFIRSGRPPTLWCVLIVADGPRTETDSITSG